ncbi:MAG: ORF6N domain-containing protein [Candidatus Omnitrophica bacterium]|nr:ORF6N domain-containing protein [Candidatus Omnitrophota bacterium]
MIRSIRGHRVILDVDLAGIYGVKTSALNQAVKRNADKFPEDFMFRLTREEFAALISQYVTSNKGRGGRHKQPNVFSEHGAVMAANVLRSSEAVRMSIFVVRAFIKMRELLSGRKELAEQLAALEKKLTERLDVHEVAIVDILQRIMTIIDPPPPPPVPPKPRIGF